MDRQADRGHAAEVQPRLLGQVQTEGCRSPWLLVNTRRERAVKLAKEREGRGRRSRRKGGQRDKQTGALVEHEERERESCETQN